MEHLRDITLDDLPEEQKRIADLIGIDAYRKLVEAFGGMMIYVQKPDSFLRAARNDEIRKKFDGSNYRQLAAQYNLTEVAIRLIVADVDKEMRARPIEGQETLF